MHALLHADDAPPAVNISSGCDEGYACAQNIASLASWWIQTNASTAGLDRHAPFLAWYFKYLRAQADPATGLWCTPSQVAKHGEMNCIGGSFHVDLVMQHGGMCGNFDIIMTHHFGPFLAYPQPFTAPHTPCGVLYLGAMLLGC